MCLAVPGEVLSVGDDALRTARVSFSGVVKEVALMFVPEADVGAWVLVHAGFAIATVSEAHAQEVLQLVTRADGP
mgnify:CR=1 FL=1